MFPAASEPVPTAPSPWFPALRLALLSVLLLGLGYPAVVVLTATALTPETAAGSLVVVEGRLRGSRLVAQPFVGDRYLQGRPMPTPDPMAAAGSNLGPLDPALQARVAEAAKAYAGREAIPVDAVPADAVTVSGSGFDPDISVANARLQVPRIAATRGLPPETVLALIDRHTEPALLGVIGVPRVHVLDVNRALDAAGVAGASE